MIEDWEVKRIGDFCNTSAGGTPLKSHKDYYENGTIPFLRSGEVGQGEILESKNFITQKGLNNSSAKLFPKDSVLVAMYGATAGEVGILRFEAATNQAVCAIFPNDSILPKYLYSYLMHYKEKLVAKAIGNAQSNLSQTKIKNIEIPLPPLEEQKRVVSILDEAFEAIDQSKANIERNIENAEELFQSKLHDIFKSKGKGWESKKLKEIGKLISGQHIKSDNYNNERRGIGYLTGPSDFGEIYPIISKWTEYPKRTARTNDILITVKGSGVGKINLMDKDELAISRQLKALRVKKANTRFVYLFLSLQYDYLQDLANGAAIPGLSIGDIMELKISIPDENIQNRLVDRIISFEDKKTDLIENYKKKLNSLRELKKSILQQAFSGKLSQKEELVA